MDLEGQDNEDGSSVAGIPSKYKEKIQKAENKAESGEMLSKFNVPSLPIFELETGHQILVAGLVLLFILVIIFFFFVKPALCKELGVIGNHLFC